MIKEVKEAISKAALDRVNGDDEPDLKEHICRIQERHETLNTRYAAVHRLLSHKKPIRRDDIPEIRETISSYMTYYRAYGTQEVNVIPKQHILESHCVHFIKKKKKKSCFFGFLYLT